MNDQTHEPLHPLQRCLIGYVVLLCSLTLNVQAQDANVTAPTTVSAVTPVQLQIRLAQVDRRVLRELIPGHGITSSALLAHYKVNRHGQLGGRLDQNAARASVTEAPQTSTPINLLMGGATDLAESSALIRALQTKVAWRELAAPANLTIAEGEQTKFLVGSGVPIPLIATDEWGQNIVTAQVQEFGLRLQLRPVLLDEMHLRLELEPEIVSADADSSVTVGNLVIPGLRLRKAQTVLELREGQGFALTGLFDPAELASLARIPGLAAGPVLGELLKGSGPGQNETELLVLITVKFSNSPQSDQLANQPKEAGVSSPAPKPPAPRLAGVSGHAIEVKRDALPVEAVVSKAKRNSDISVQVEAVGEKLEKKSDKKENEDFR